MIRLSSAACVAGFTLLAVAVGFAQAKSHRVKRSTSYKAVAPVIKAQCASCHNDERHPDGVNLSSYESLMKSGEHGSIVVPGHPEKSKLIMYIDGEKQPRMPFKKKPLTAGQINFIKGWIKAGAKP